MSSRDAAVQHALSLTMQWLDDGKQKHDELAGLPLKELLERLPKLEREELEKIVLYELVRLGEWSEPIRR